MFKNVASQKIALFAFTTTTGAAKTGDAANLTAYVSKDYGAATVLGDTSATELEATNAPGWYLFDLTQAETNADDLLFTAKSGTANVAVVGRPISTLPASFTSHVAQTGDSYAQVTNGTHGLAALETLVDGIESTIGAAGAGLTALATAASLATTDGKVDGIKNKTDSLTFTVAGEADVNVKSVNDITVTGAGTAGDPWGP